jgi:hypothetical protein
MEFGTNRSRLASGDRLGCADPLVGSLYGFLRIAYLIFYYGTTLIRHICHICRVFPETVSAPVFHRGFPHTAGGFGVFDIPKSIGLVW